MRKGMSPTAVSATQVEKAILTSEKSRITVSVKGYGTPDWFVSVIRLLHQLKSSFNVIKTEHINKTVN